jgi:gliding motility-associated-like protein
MKVSAKYLSFSVAFFISLLSSVSAQDFSNRGTDFWVAYGYHQVMTGNNGQDMVLYFAAEQATTVTVTIPGTGYTQTYNVAANSVLTSATLPKAGTQDARLLTETGLPENKGIHITSTQPIVCYAHIYNQSVSGATILFPTNTLGREYYSINFTNNSNTVNSNCWAYVIATDTGTTTVEIIPSAPTLTRPSGIPFTVNLTQGQVFNIMGQTVGNSGVDLTGTSIRSINIGSGCKKIAVFSGSGRINIACGFQTSTTSSDNYMVQAFPKNAWGKKFLTATSGSTQTFNFFRVCVADPTTNVLVNGAPIGFPLQNNFYYEIGPTNQPMRIEADQPITIAQYFTSQSRCGNGTPGDPEVIYLSPVEQNINRVLFNSNILVAANPQHHVNVIVPNGGTGVSSFRIDGAVPSVPFTVHPGDANYSYIKIPGLAQGQHLIQSDSGFNAIAYGFANAESYGYNAGTNVIDLYQFITTQNANAIVNAPVSCKSSPFNISITLPYVPLSLKWEIAGYPDVVNNSPVPDSTYVLNGRTLNVFRLPNPYVYNTIGNYPVKVTVNTPALQDGCPGIQIINWTLQVFDPPTPSFTINSRGCVDSAIVFTTNNNGQGRPIIRHYWSFGDNTFSSSNNPVKTFTAPGSYNVRYAIMTDIGCLSDTITLPVPVTNTPVAKFGFTNPQCQGKQITFGDTSTLSGNYGSIVNWNWNLGNGTILNNPNRNSVSTTYPNTISYTASLQVRTNTGCLSPLFSLPVTINPNPVPNFTNQYACLPDGVVNFTGTSTIADGTQNLFTYLWNFGDLPSGPLNSSLIKDPTHKYSTTGPYSVKLRVTSNRGCIDSVTRSIANIYPQPRTDFTAPAEVCYQTPVTFTDQTNGITHPVNRWEWRFKDALGTVIGSSTQRNPVYNFPAPGTYFVEHWAFTNQNCVSDTVQKQIVINPWPTAAFSLGTPACERNQVTLTNTSVPNAGTLVRWYWNLGDGTIINATNGNPVTHTYTNWGSKPIKMLVESSKGCLSDTLRQPILINPLPRIGYRLPEVCLTDGFATFNDTSGIPDGSASQLQYLWTFNTAAIPVTPSPTPLTSTLKNPVIQFFTAADYQLNLKVESKDGCKDSVNNIPFTVNGVIARTDYQIRPTNGLCSNREVEIQNKSSVTFGWLTRVEIYWDWANNPTQVEVDDVPLVDEIYKHQYPNFQTPLTRTFRVRLRAFSGIVCEKDTIQDIIVNASPLTRFDPMTGICVDAVPRQITQAVETGGLPGTGVFSGPGVNSSGLFNPANAGVGTHIIRYTFTASNGCTHFSEQTIEVWPRPVAKLNTVLPNCEKNAITFNSTGSVSNATNLTGWQWNFGDGSLIVSTASNAPVNHIYNAYGNYTVNLVVTNNRGCNSLPEPLNIKVNPLPIVDFALPKICLPDGTGQFTDLSTIPDNTQSSFKYKWDFGDNFVSPANSDTSSLKNPVYKYSNLGPYTVKLIVTSNNNCVDSLPRQLVDVFPQPKANFTTSADSICIGQSIDFTDASDGIVSTINRWKWSFGNGDSSFIENPRYRYPNAATVPFSVKLYVYSDQGCVSDTAEKLIDVWAYPVVSAGPDFTMLQDGIRVIGDARATGTGLQFLWSPATYLNNVRLLNPSIVKPQDDITYLLTVSGRGGCVTDDEVNVKILKTPKPPNTFTPNGDGINEFWEIKYLNDYPGCIVEVYNTAGTLLYRSIGYSTPWDGKYKGQTLPAGTYYYVIDPKNGRSRIAGYVTILR